MRKETVTWTYWQSMRIGPYREIEYAQDVYYIDGEYVGESDLYYTGRGR